MIRRLLVLLLLSSPLAAEPLRDALGRQVNIEGTPRRVVALGHGPFLQLATLGLRPVGAHVNPAFAAMFAALFDDPRPIPGVNAADWTPEPELVAALRPDLVIGYSLTEAMPLERVAPFLAIREFASIAHVEDNLRELARLLGRTDRAEAAIAAFEAALASARARGAPRRSVMFVAGRSPQRFTVAAAQNMLCRVADAVADCGGVSPAARTPYVELSLEALLRADPEVLVLGHSPAARAGYLAALRRDPLWQRLRAVREGRVVVYDGYQDISIRGLPAARRVLDILMPALE